MDVDGDVCGEAVGFSPGLRCCIRRNVETGRGGTEGRRDDGMRDGGGRTDEGVVEQNNTNEPSDADLTFCNL
jgi:hypothetical protein